MILTDEQHMTLVKEFMAEDLGRLPMEAPVTRAKRGLTRALFERPEATAEEVIPWVVECLDRVVTAWENPLAHVNPDVTDGVRAAATIIAESAERVGLVMPVQPPRVQPGFAVEDVDPALAEETREADLLDQGLLDWTPADGGVTPSMFKEA